MTYPKISFKIKKRIKDFLIVMIVLIQLESCSKKPKNTEISNTRISIKKPKTKKKIPITFTVDAKKIKEKGDLNMTVDIIEGEGEVDLANSTIRIKDNNKIEKTFYYTPNTPGNHKLSINANGLGVELKENISINVSDEIIDTNFTIKVTKKKNYPGDKVQISIHTKEKNHDRLIINAKSKSNNGKLIEERNTCISYYFIADKPGDYEIEIESYDKENLKNIKRKTIKIKICPFEYKIQNISLNNSSLSFDIKSSGKELEYILSDINIEDGEIEICTKSDKKDQKGRLKLLEGKNKLKIFIKTIPIESTKIQLKIEGQFGSAKKIEVDIKNLCKIKKTEQKIIEQNRNKDKIQSIIELEREIIKSLTKKRKKVLRNNKLTNADLLSEEIGNEKKELISLQKKRKKIKRNNEINLNTSQIDEDIKKELKEYKKLEKRIITNPNGILESCILKNDLERLQKILSENEYDLNNKNGANLLYSAYKNKNIESLKILLEQNIESYKDKDNKTLLHLAAAEGEIEILNILLDKTDNKNPKDKEDKTPFDLAIQNERESIIKTLAKWNKENLKNLITKACKKGDIRTTKLLLENCYKINQKLEKKETIKNIFQEAIEQKDQILFKTLLESTDKSYHKKLIHKTLKKNWYIASKILIDSKIDIKETDENQKTPLEIVIEKREGNLAKQLSKITPNEELERIIKHYQANDNYKTIEFILNYCIESETPKAYEILQESILHKKINIIKLLLKRGLNINEYKDEDENTLLHQVCLKSDLEYIKLLLKYNADPHQKNINNKSSLDIAIKKKNKEMIKLLLNNIHPIEFGIKNNNKKICKIFSNDKEQIKKNLDIFLKKENNHKIKFILENCYTEDEAEKIITQIMLECLKNRDIKSLKIILKIKKEIQEIILQAFIKEDWVDGIKILLKEKASSSKLYDNNLIKIAIKNRNRKIAKMISKKTKLYEIEELLEQAYKEGNNETLIFILKNCIIDKFEQKIYNKYLLKSYSKPKLLKEIVKLIHPDSKKDKKERTLLFKACLEENAEAAKILIENKANHLLNDKNGICPLDIIIEKRNHKIFDLIKQTIMDGLIMPQYFDKYFKKKSLKTLKFLFKKGLQIKDLENKGTKYLEIAYKEKNHKMLEFLLKQGVKSKSNMLIEACKDNWKEGQDILIHYNKNTKKEDNNKSSLEVAIENKDYSLMDKLLKSVINQDWKNKKGGDFLKESYKRKDLKMMNIFLESGINPNKWKDPNLNTLLHIIFKEDRHGNNKQYAKLLLNHGAEINIQNKKNETPLHIINYKNTDGSILDVLYANNEEESEDYIEELTQDIDLNILNKKGKNTLEIAIENDHLEAVKKLVKLGANLNYKNKQSFIPLAIKNRNADILGFLLKHDKETYKQKDDNILHQVVKMDWKEGIEQILLNKRILITKPNKENKTPLELMINKNLHSFLNQINKKEKLETLKYICLRKDTYKAKNFINNYIEDKHNIYENLIGDLKSTNDTTKPIIETLIKCKFEEKYSSKETLFKKAYDVENEEIMEFISSCGSNLELWRDTHNRSLLKIALDKNDLNEMKKLLKYGANPDYYRNSNKERLVYEAFSKNKKEALKLLLNHGANPNGQILLKAIEKKDIEICEMLIKAGSDPYCEVEPYIGKRLNSMPIFNMDYNTFKIFYDKGLIGEEIITKVPMNTFIKNTIKSFNSSSNKDRIKIFEFIFTKIIKPKDWESKNEEINIQNIMSKDELIEGLKMLHRLGFNLNYKSQDGYTPLETALKNEQFKAFLYLIELGINQNFNNENKEEFSKAISRAYKEKNYEILKAISKNRLSYDSFSNKINKKLLIKAYKDKNINELRSILKNKVDPDIAKNKKGLSLLHSACIEGIADITKLLLEYGANPNLKSKEYNYTPIHCAARNGHTKIINLLAKSKNMNINFNIEDEKGFTPLDYALAYKHFETMKALINVGVKKIKDPKNYKQITYEEYKSNNNENLEIIFKSGIHPDLCRDKYERTLLFATCLSRDIDKIKLLLKYGANPNLKGKDKYGYAIIHCIAQSGDIDLLKIIIENSKIKIDFDIKDNANRNPMYHAFRYRKFEMMKTLKYCGSKEITKFKNAIIIKEYNENNKENLENIFKSGIHPDSYRDNEGRTLLNLASCDKSKIEIIKLLLKYGANPNLQDTKYGYSPIHYAAQNGNIKILKLLASSKNINFDIKDKKSLTPLDHALTYKHFKTMQTLVDFGAKSINKLENHKKIICEEYINNNIKNLEIIFKSGIHPDLYGSESGTLLHNACYVGDIEKIKLLLKYNANCNLQGKHDYTPIHCIAQNGKPELIKIIGNHSKVKLNFDARDEKSLTPMDHAFQYKHFEMMQVLIDVGAKKVSDIKNGIVLKEYINNNIKNLEILFKSGIHPDFYRDKKGETLLHNACKSNKTEMVKLLLKYGANPNLQGTDEFGYTPIHWAVQEGCDKAIDIISKNSKIKINLDLRDKKNYTPLDRALQSKRYKIMQQLINKGARAIPNFKNHTDIIYNEYENNKINNLETILKAIHPDLLYKDDEGETLLHYACSEGKSEMVNLLLKYGANPNLQSKDEYGYTPIHWAMQNGHSKVLEILKKYKTNLNILDKKEINPLTRAYNENQYETLKKLLELKENPNLWRDKKGETLLHYACADGKEKILKLLLKYGANPNLQGTDEWSYTPVHWAAQNGNSEIIKLIANKSKIKVNFYTKDKKGYTSLDRAFQSKHYKTIQTLVNLGARDMPNAKNHIDIIRNEYDRKNLDNLRILFDCGIHPDLWKSKNGETLLHYACITGQKETAKLLLEKGADPNLQSKDEYGYTPIHWAAQKGFVEILKILKSYNADFNVLDKKGINPLIRAYNENDLKTMKILLERGADPNWKDIKGETILHYASKKGEIEVIKLLLQYGANPNLQSKDTFGYTPIHWLAQEGYENIINIIADNSKIDINFDIKDKKGYTPLDRAFQSNHFKVMKTLINEGAEDIPNAKSHINIIKDEYDKNNYENLEIIFESNINPDKYKDNDGETLLHYACKDGKLAIVKLLLKYRANPNLKGTDKYGYTPIHWAVQKGHNEIINIIANNSMIEANFDIKDKKGYTPLDRALEKKHFETMEILMNEGAKRIPNAKNNADVISNEYINNRIGNLKTIFSCVNPNDIKYEFDSTLLHISCMDGNTEIVKLLLKKGADCNLKQSNNWNYTRIHFAAQNGHTDVIETISNYSKVKANFNAKCKNDLKPLDLAFINGHFETMQALIDLKAKGISSIEDNINIIKDEYDKNDYNNLKTIFESGVHPDLWKDRKGETLLHYACKNKNIKMMNLLLKYGSNPNLQSKDRWGYTPIHWIAQEGYGDMIEDIINYSNINLKLDLKDKQGYSPLDRAFQFKHFKTMELLLDAGAKKSYNAKNHIDIICEEYNNNRIKNLEIIFRSGVHPDLVKGEDNKILLHYACENGKTELVKLLLQYGSNPNLRALNKYGYTPIHWAAHNGHDELISILAHYGKIKGDLSIKNKKGASPRRVANKCKQYKTAKVLIKLGGK